MTACVLSRSFVALIALTVACGDSDPTGSTGPGGAPSTSAQTTASTTDTSSSTSSSSSDSVTSSSTSSTGGEGGQGGEGGTGGMAPSCDIDGDGSNMVGPGCCGAPDPCDCDDNDPDTFPGQTAWFTEPRPNVAPNAPNAFDYNCDGSQEKQYPQDIDGCGLLSCTATLSFFGDEGEYFCGATGALLQCSLLTCAAIDVVDLGCR